MNNPKVKFFTSAKGESIAYAIHGSGPFLLLPAWWVSHLELDWKNTDFRHFFELLGEQHTVVRYDRLGVGLSERQRNSFELKDEVTTLTELIDHIGAQHCSLLGLSCGGPVAVFYAHLNPHRVDKLVLINSFVDGKHIGNDDLKQALCSLVSASWGLGSKAIIDIFDPDMLDKQRKLLGQIHKSSVSADMALNLLKLTYKMNATKAAKSIIKPTLVLHRSKDRTIPVIAGRCLAAMIKNAEFKSLEGKAHLPWIGAEADQIVKDILAFTVSHPSQIQTDFNQFKQIDDVWVLTYAQKTVHIKDALGLHDLNHLISNPGKEIHVRFLANGKTIVDHISTRETEILDNQSISAYRYRLIELEEAQHQAAQGEDENLYEKLEDERDALQNELTHALGISGRQRTFSSDDEKARKAISARIHSSIKRIEGLHTELGEHLKQFISTGNFCCYNITEPQRWHT